MGRKTRDVWDVDDAASSPKLTRRQRHCLEMMVAAKQEGQDWVEPAYQARVLRVLVRHDLIFRSVGIDGSVKYRVTGRGVKLVERLNAARHRSDGLCPRCQTEPRAVSSSGRRLEYCRACLRSSYRENYVRRGGKTRSAGMCNRCGANPRLRSPGGGYNLYCRHCTNAQLRVWHQRNRVRVLERGELPQCKYPGCGQPVVVYNTYVGYYCNAHDAQRHRLYRRQRQRRRMKALLKSVRKNVDKISAS